MKGLAIGCLVVPFCLIVYFGAAIAFINHWNLNPYQPQSMVDFFAKLWIGLGIVSFLLVLAAIWAFVRHRNGLGGVLLLGMVAGLTSIAIVISASGQFPSHIGMTRTSFLLSSATVGSGYIYFYNPPSGITQTLCIGVNQHCDSSPIALPQLEHGLVIHPGQTLRVEFDRFETDTIFHVTSVTTPHMDVDIDDPVPSND